MYDQTKNYTWQPETNFELSGTEFGVTFHFMRQRKIELLKELEVINVFEKKFADMIDKGLVTEFTPKEEKSE
jgi:hypothetical protein